MKHIWNLHICNVILHRKLWDIAAPKSGERMWLANLLPSLAGVIAVQRQQQMCQLAHIVFPDLEVIRSSHVVHVLLPNGVLQAPPWVDLPMQAPLHVSAKQLAPQCCNRGKQQKAFLLEGTELALAAAAGPQALKTAMLCSLCCRPMQARQEAESRALRTHQAQEHGSCCDMLRLWLRGYLHRASTMGLRPLKHACAAEHQDLTIHTL